MAYGAYVEDGPAIYAAWSQGATLASVAIKTANDAAAADGGQPVLRFDRAVLVEVGHTAIDAKATVSALHAAGVSHVLVSCSSKKCRSFATDARAAAKVAGLSLHVVDVGDRGHWFDAPVFEAIGAELPWLTQDDSRWSAAISRLPHTK
jgi:hypothetical protein